MEFRKLKIMENKYYIPEIEEFHVGFEFEHKSIGKNEWNKEVTEVIDIKNIEGIQRVIKNNDIRVKYLDKEDIESLGWKLHKLKVGTEEFEIIHNKKNNIVIKSSIDENMCYPITRFNGTIKNKSELKKLMKQLNIIK